MPAKSVSKKHQKTSSTKTVTQKPTMGFYVLQLLTYTFWCWLSVTLVSLLFAILEFYLLDDTFFTTTAITYVLASLIIVLPLVVITDTLFTRSEAPKKEGASAVIATLFSVLFALGSIGSLVLAVFTLFELIMNPGGDPYLPVIVASLAAAAILSGGAFIRVLDPLKTKLSRYLYRYVLLGISIVLFIFACAGPVAYGIKSRDDRRISANLSYVSQGIDAYISEHNKYPESLDNIDLSRQEAQSIVDDGLVEYKKGEIHKAHPSSTYSQYRFELCVTYKYADSTSKATTGHIPHGTPYSQKIHTTNHPAGSVCYKTYASVSSTNPATPKER